MRAKESEDESTVELSKETDIYALGMVSDLLNMYHGNPLRLLMNEPYRPCW